MEQQQATRGWLDLFWKWRCFCCPVKFDSRIVAAQTYSLTLNAVINDADYGGTRFGALEGTTV